MSASGKSCDRLSPSHDPVIMRGNASPSGKFSAFASYQACYPPAACAGLTGRAGRGASARVFASPEWGSQIGLRRRATLPRLLVVCPHCVTRRRSSGRRILNSGQYDRAHPVPGRSAGSTAPCPLLSLSCPASTSLIDECPLAKSRAVPIYLGEDHETLKAGYGRISNLF